MSPGFRLLAVRPAKKVGSFTSEWLRGRCDDAEVLEEARALLDDPRDCITAIFIWNERTQQFSGRVRKEHP